MGAYAYCTKCDAGFDRPTARQLAKGERECHSCRYINTLHATAQERLEDLAELVDEANDRIGELEANVRFLLDQVKDLKSPPQLYY
jgi:hypothetical protein